MRRFIPLCFIPILGIIFTPCAMEEDLIDNIFLFIAAIIYHVMITAFFLPGLFN